MKKETIYKTMYNNKRKSFIIEETEGYKKVYNLIDPITNKKLPTIIVGFTKEDNGKWLATEYTTGALLSNNLFKTIKQFQDTLIEYDCEYAKKVITALSLDFNKKRANCINNYKAMLK